VTADQLQRTHPLHARLGSLQELPVGFSVVAEPFLAMTSVRVRPDGPAASALAATLGASLPITPNTWIRTDVATAIWLGPDEWLVVTDLDTVAAQEEHLRSMVMGDGGAAVDVSGQRVTLRLSGSHVRDVLAKGCALDLHRDVFRPGASAQTTLGCAGIVLIADAEPDHFTMLVRASFVDYLVDWLVDAAAEFRVDVG
jgi:sarcosine oxidase subunit gamma